MPEMATFHLDLRDPAFIADPYPTYHRLRETAPVWKAPYGRWFLSRYEDAANMLRDRRFGKDYGDPEALTTRFGPTALQEPAVIELSNMLLMRDPPDHTRLRGLVTKAFTARRIEAMRTRVREITNELLDKVFADGRIEAIHSLAFPLPVLVICELLGVPKADQAEFIKGSATGAALLNPSPPTRADLDDANEATLKAATYFEALFERRRREPEDDLISQLVQAEESGDRLSTAELSANVRLLFAAGHETTVNLIGNGLLSLLRNRDQWNILRDDRSLIPNAVEELLRYETPVQSIMRTMVGAVELDGFQIERQDIVVCLLGAANRDPAVFENPDKLDVTRKDVRHMLSFGGSIHFCLGAQLARLEGVELLNVLLERMPDLHLLEPDAPKWRPVYPLRGLYELPLGW